VPTKDFKELQLPLSHTWFRFCVCSYQNIYINKKGEMKRSTPSNVMLIGDEASEEGEMDSDDHRS